MSTSILERRVTVHAVRTAYAVAKTDGGLPPDGCSDEDALAFCLRILEAAATSADAPAGPPDPVLTEIVAELASLAGRREPADAQELLPQIEMRAIARARGRGTSPPTALRTPQGPGDVAGEAIDRPYVGFFALERHRLRHRRHDGSWSEPMDRLVFASGDAVTVLPYDPTRDSVLLIEQFRAGPFARRDPLPWCLETIAGRCDAHEDLEETARREAREEAGLELGRIERVLGYYPTPAIAAEHITSFVAEARLDRAEGIFGLAHEHEDIRAFVLPREQAEAAVASGEVNNAPLALSLMWLALNWRRLGTAWSA